MRSAFFRRAAITGLIAGTATVHVSMVGIVETFQRKAVITEYLSLGTVLPPLLILIAAYYASGPLREGARPRPDRATAIGSGIIVGVVAAAVLALLATYIDLVQPRGIFNSASPALVNTLRFGLDPVAGSLAMLAMGAVSGSIGALFNIVPGRIARALAIALVVTLTLALMERFVNQVLANLPLRFLAQFLYLRGGLTLVGAISVFVLVAVGSYAWSTRGHVVKTTIASRPPPQKMGLRIGAFAVLGLILAVLPWIVGLQLSEAIGTVGIYILLGLGLNIVVGYAGLLDLGYVAFYAVGSYTLAMLTSPVASVAIGMNFWVAIPFVMFAAAIAGLMIGAPVLRLRGDYLAIVTLGLGEIARIVLLSDWMKPYLGGAQGILSIPAPELLGVTFRGPQTLYYLILISCVIAAIAAISLANSRIGRAWNAMREDEVVAEATGINTHKTKLLAFMLGATFGCLGGAFFAVKLGSVFPHSFELLVSINALALIILGGMGSIPGVIVGAIVLVGLPELLREFAEYRLLFYGAILIGMMILKPEGLLPNRARSAELHEHEDEDDQYASDAGTESGEPVVTTT
jgi:branched-chain amino acid transport system permease protein